MDKNNKDAIVASIIGGIVSAVVSAVFAFVLNIFSSNLPWLLFIISCVLFTIIIGETIYIFVINKKAKEKEEESNLLRGRFKRYEEVGITDCTRELKGTDLEPKKCMETVKHTLDFMGVGGSKWVKSNDECKQFEKMLRRVQANKGNVRFLIIDPLGHGYKELEGLRGADAIPKESYKSLCSLSQRYPCFQIRLYNHLPTFRLQFIDNKYVAASRYFFEKEQFYKFSQGWDIPHLIVNADIMISPDEIQYKGSLFNSFLQLYDFIWESSKDISSLIGTEILK